MQFDYELEYERMPTKYRIGKKRIPWWRRILRFIQRYL